MLAHWQTDKWIDIVKTPTIFCDQLNKTFPVIEQILCIEMNFQTISVHML